MDQDLMRKWMWSEAVELVTRAERLHRQFFRPSRARARAPAWEPPADVLETDDEIVVVVALPGVRADSVEVAAEGLDLLFAGVRALPAELRGAVIHRLELPQGRFERRLRLPPGRYGAVRHVFVDGCLLIAIAKKDAPRE